jgi:hypothetical protein
MSYEGIATMYLSMSMASQALPILGSCTVQDKKINLKFPLASVSFDLPEAPSETGKDLEFKMAGPRGDMTLKISYKSDLGAFMGLGVQNGQNTLSFVFHKADSPLKHLKNL